MLTEIVEYKKIHFGSLFKEKEVSPTESGNKVKKTCLLGVAISVLRY